jgi:hypothetical protein
VTQDSVPPNKSATSAGPHPVQRWRRGWLRHPALLLFAVVSIAAFVGGCLSFYVVWDESRNLQKSQNDIIEKLVRTTGKRHMAWAAAVDVLQDVYAEPEGPQWRESRKITAANAAKRIREFAPAAN